MRVKTIPTTPVDETFSHSILTLTNWNSAHQTTILIVFIISDLIEETF